MSYGVLPVYRTVKEFTQLRANDQTIYTEPFYTAQGGFKMTLRVYPNGHSTFKGTHLSVRTFLMRGENDETLTFPICGTFRIQLLNWRENSGHVERIWQFDDAISENRRQRVTTGEIATYGWGLSEFLSHDELQNSSDKKYINNDQLCFKIQFEPAHGQQTTGVIIKISFYSDFIFHACFFLILISKTRETMYVIRMILYDFIVNSTIFQ